MQLTSDYDIRVVDCGFIIKFLSTTLSKDTQPFDFIKYNIIPKLAYKVKNISQINVALIMFFGNLRLRFLKISWLNCEQYGKNQYKKKEHNQQFSVQSVKITFILLKSHRSVDNSNDYNLVILL